MGVEIKTNNKQKLHIKLSKAFVNIYLLIVLALGLAYLVEARTGNIGTILAYMVNKDNLAAQAYIFKAVFELLFILFAIFGSTMLLILFNIRYKKSKVLSILVILLTTLFYIASRVFLITGTVQMVTNGVIKNTDFSDISAIFSQYLTLRQSVPITVTLLVGVLILPLIIGKFNIFSSKIESKNPNFV